MNKEEELRKDFMKKEQQAEKARKEYTQGAIAVLHHEQRCDTQSESWLKGYDDMVADIEKEKNRIRRRSV